MQSSIKKKLLKKYHAQNVRQFNSIYVDPKRLKEQWCVYEHEVFKNSFTSAPRKMVTKGWGGTLLEGWQDILLEYKRKEISNVKNKMLRSKYAY